MPISRLRLAGVLLVLLAVLSVLVPGGAIAPNVTPVIQSPTPSVSFNNSLYNYVLTASVPVNWTKVAAPAGFTLTGGPLSTQADLQGTFAVSGAPTFSVRATTPAYQGSLNVWQNWTVTVLNTPYITSTPAFTVTAGAFYDYKPVCVNCAGKSFKFVGAPWLTLVPSTGEVSGTVGSGTWTNVLTLNTTTANWTQAWDISTGTLPTTLSASGNIGNHPINATVPTTDVLGIGRGGVFLGPLVLVVPAEMAGTSSYLYTYIGATASNDYIAAANAGNKTLIIYAYGVPFTTVTVTVNTNQAVSTPTMNSGGYTTVTFGAPVFVPNGGCGNNCGGGGGNGGPSVPANITSTATMTSVTLSWTIGVPASYYIVHFGKSCSALSGSTLVYTTSATVSSLAASTSYCFQITAYNAAGAPANSATYTTSTSSVASNPFQNSPTLTWPTLTWPTFNLNFKVASVAVAIAGIGAILFGILFTRGTSTIVSIVIVIGGIALVVYSFFI